MSRDLPAHPSLEYLRKEAKTLLDELQRRDPSAKLADAQHTLAKEYGFSSWTTLKMHVESLPPREAAPRANPFVGEWIADLERSIRHPANPFLSATIRIDADGDTLTISDLFVDESGRENRGVNVVHADGIAREMEYGYVLTASWRGPHVLETSAKKDGEVVGWGTYEVSADGRTLVVTAKDQRIVLVRLRTATA